MPIGDERLRRTVDRQYRYRRLNRRGFAATPVATHNTHMNWSLRTTLASSPTSNLLSRRLRRCLCSSIRPTKCCQPSGRYGYVSACFDPCLLACCCLLLLLSFIQHVLPPLCDWYCSVMELSRRQHHINLQKALSNISSHPTH